MTLEIYLAIATFCFVTTITPGPNNIMLMTSGLNHGIRKTLPHYFGIFLGFPAMVAAIGLGLGAVFLAYPIIHQTIKIIGIVYLLFLAWKIANAGNPEASDKLKKPFSFLQAVAFQWVNPKAWIIAIGAIATFTTPGNVTVQVIAIVIGYMTVGSSCMALWLFLGASLQVLVQNPHRLKMFNVCMAILLVLSVLSMAVTDLSGSA